MIHNVSYYKYIFAKISPVEFPILINWMSPFVILGVLGVFFNVILLLI